MCKITKKIKIKQVTALQDASAYSAPRRCAVHFADCASRYRV